MSDQILVDIRCLHTIISDVHKCTLPELKNAIEIITGEKYENSNALVSIGMNKAKTIILKLYPGLIYLSDPNNDNYGITCGGNIYKFPVLRKPILVDENDEEQKNEEKFIPLVKPNPNNNKNKKKQQNKAVKDSIGLSDKPKISEDYGELLSDVD